MLIKVGNWKQGLLRFKRSGGWVNPSALFVKQSGEWNLLSGLEVVNWGLGDLLDSSETVKFSHDTVRGWYRDSYTWSTPVYTKLTPETLAKIRKVSVTITGYYDYPNGALGENLLVLDLSDGSAANIGTVDGNTDPAPGQAVYRGDLGLILRYVGNINQQKYTYTVPEGLSVVNIRIYSNGYNGTGINYPFSYRGMKDFEFTLQH